MANNTQKLGLLKVCYTYYHTKIKLSTKLTKNKYFCQYLYLIIPLLMVIELN